MREPNASPSPNRACVYSITWPSRGLVPEAGMTGMTGGVIVSRAKMRHAPESKGQGQSLLRKGFDRAL